MIAKKRVRELKRVSKGPLGEGVVGADAKNLDIEVLKILVIDLPGREVRCSHRPESRAVELEENKFLSPKLAQADFSTHCTG